MAHRKTGVILGIGEFGLHLAKALSREGCDVIAVDLDKKKIELIRDFVQSAIIADIRKQQTLAQIVPMDSDFVVVALGTIESSIIATLYLKEMGIEKIFIKAVSDEHERILRMLGMTNIIFPEKDMGERISSRLMTNNFLDYLPLANDYSIAEVAPLPVMQGKTLMELNFRKIYDLSVVAIKELVPPRMVFTPEANFVIKISDILVVLGKKETIDKYKVIMEK